MFQLKRIQIKIQLRYKTQAEQTEKNSFNILFSSTEKNLHVDSNPSLGFTQRFQDLNRGGKRTKMTLFFSLTEAGAPVGTRALEAISLQIQEEWTDALLKLHLYHTDITDGKVNGNETVWTRNTLVNVTPHFIKAQKKRSFQREASGYYGYQDQCRLYTLYTPILQWCSSDTQTLKPPAWDLNL